MAGYSSASWANRCARNGCITEGYPAAFQLAVHNIRLYPGKLFTFLDHDGVPWNNNNAEHAIKCFARHRRFADGRFTEASIKDYLVILSVYQTCEYRGINFLDFLRGKGQGDVGGFGSERRKPSITDGGQTGTEQPAPDPGLTAGGDRPPT
jgi:hypothetical protein